MVQATAMGYDPYQRQVVEQHQQVAAYGTETGHWVQAVPSVQIAQPQPPSQDTQNEIPEDETGRGSPFVPTWGREEDTEPTPVVEDDGRRAQPIVEHVPIVHADLKHETQLQSAGHTEVVTAATVLPPEKPQRQPQPRRHPSQDAVRHIPERHAEQPVQQPYVHPRIPQKPPKPIFGSGRMRILSQDITTSQKRIDDLEQLVESLRDDVTKLRTRLDRSYQLQEELWHYLPVQYADVTVSKSGGESENDAEDKDNDKGSPDQEKEESEVQLYLFTTQGRTPIEYIKYPVGESVVTLNHLHTDREDRTYRRLQILMHDPNDPNQKIPVVQDAWIDVRNLNNYRLAP